MLFGGLKIGKVPRRPQHNADYTGVIIKLEIYQDEKIPTDAKFGIGTAGLMGDTYVEIQPTGGGASTYYEDGDVVEPKNITTASGLSALQDTAKELSEKVKVAIDDLRATLGDVRVSLKKINEGALTDQNMQELKGSFEHLNSVLTRLDEQTLNEQTSKDVKEAVASFKSAANSLDTTVKKLDPAVSKLEGVVDKADKAMASADKAMKSLDNGAAALGKVGTDIKRGEGLLPALIYDRNLKNEFTMLITNLRQRGVLWYKDKAGEEQEENRPPRLPKR